MTYTTDIKALREQWETLHERLDLDIFITTVLTALEAERQRADKSDAMLSECLESLKAAEKELGIRSHQLVKADASVADLEKRLRCTEEALIAATDLHGADLKGDQVPVALIDERQGSGGFCLTQHGRRLSLKHGTELFTAPQKPVLDPQLLSDIRQCVIDATAWCTHRTPPDYVSNVNAWLAAVGIVKVTDKCHPSLMTSVNVPHNVIRTYFDASGGRSDIVTLSDKREMKDMSSIVKDGE